VPTPDETATAPIKVLVVDDSRLTRVNLKTALFQAREQMIVLGEAEDGQEALQLVERLRPDVVLMDIGMPILDGIQATQQLKIKFPDVKVVMLTSHDSEMDVLDAFRSGASSYCLKETSPELLIQVILATAQGSCWIDPKIAKVVLQSLAPPGGGNPAQSAQAQPPRNPGVSLTEREIEVLTLITEGLNNSDIAERLSISMNTVKTHLKNIFQKLEVEDRTAAALKALKDRII
jgi:DNA-binding NarL/FixJ family response regulator